MYLKQLYAPSERYRRLRYAIATILRDRIVNEGAFNVCFEMDGDEIIRAILRRGLKNSKLRAALRGSHLINLTRWLDRFPDLAEAYFVLDAPTPNASKEQFDEND